MRAYVAQNRADVEETCSAPFTVGIEFGGDASQRSPFHALLHRRAIGGVPEHELLDRIAYAKKVGAKSVYLLGGAPAEHSAFLNVVQDAKEAGLWVAMRSLVYPFARRGLAAAAKRAGLDSITCEVHSLGSQAAVGVREGLDALLAAQIECRGRIIVSPDTAADFEDTVKAFETLEIAIDEVEVTDPSLMASVQRLSPVEVAPAAP